MAIAIHARYRRGREGRRHNPGQMSKTTTEFGDFQTPLDLDQRICRLLAVNGHAPQARAGAYLRHRWLYGSLFGRLAGCGSFRGGN